MRIICISILLASTLHAETIQQIIPITANNIKGQVTLFEDGYYVIPSSKNALKYAYENGYQTPKLIWQKIQEIRKQRRVDQNIRKENRISTDKISDENFEKYISENRQQIIQDIETTVHVMDEKSMLSKNLAFEKIYIGYFQFFKNNANNLNGIKKQKYDWFKKINTDFKNVDKIFNDPELITTNNDFQKLFVQASEEVQLEYKNSKNQENSLLGLVNIGFGYLKGIYYGILKPAGEATTKSTLKTFYFLTNSVSTITETFFYTTSIGYNIIAPSIESGYLSALSILQWSAARTVNLSQNSIYSIQQIAVAGSKPIYKSGRWIISTSAETAENTVFAVYDYGRSSSEILFSQVKVGAVLGINAIIALPAQTLLLAANSTIFLVYDGPRLALYAAQGKINGQDITELPAGAVININELDKNGLEIKRINITPDQIQKIIQESTKD